MLLQGQASYKNDIVIFFKLSYLSSSNQFKLSAWDSAAYLHIAKKSHRSLTSLTMLQNTDSDNIQKFSPKGA